jgi:lysyl-tRNA synthetase class 2
VAWRGHGKTAFAHLADAAGRIQLYFRKDELGDERWSQLDLYDIGDVVGVSAAHAHATGEVTVRVSSVELLAKSLRPLPYGKEEIIDGQTVRHSGFADPEQRYRQRYADLAVHPEVRALFVARSRLVTAIRAFLDGRGFWKSKRPCCSRCTAARRHGRSRRITTRSTCRSSPHRGRALSQAARRRRIRPCVRVGHDFRNEGIDRTHNPEFTMLEFYQATPTIAR